MSKDLIPAQENCSILFFETLMNAKFNLSDAGYAELDKKAFGPGGVYPAATQVWKRSFDEQGLGLADYIVSRSIPTSGWVWSRGGGMMGYLEKICTQRCGSTVKAWNPMDVVAVRKNKEAELKKEIDENTNNGDKDMNMRMLNSIMKTAITDKELMPISLKQVGKNERGAFEMSKELQGRNARLRSYHEFVADNFKCDLEWSIYKNEWKTSQEISWDMIDNGGSGRKPYGVHVQGRTFQAKSPREQPQHSGAVIKGTGAMLGKSAIDELKAYLKKSGVGVVPSPTKHPKIPNQGKVWSQSDKDYWIGLYNTLKNARIEGQKIDFGDPGSYGESMSDVKKGFSAALDAASQADYNGDETKTGRSSGSRLTAKLWGLEWLNVYYQLSRKNRFKPFMAVLLEAMKKEGKGSGPFIKVYGKPGKGRGKKY